MVSRQTQKDVGAAEPKLIGPFTIRQCIFIGIGAFVGFVIFTIAGAFEIDTFSRFIICAPFVGGIIFLGFKKFYGMLPEDYLVQYYAYHYLAPSVRIYSTKTDIERFLEEEEQREKQEMNGKKAAKPVKKKKSKNPPLPKPDPEYPMYP